MGGEGLKDIFGSEILAKRNFLGSMKDTGIFWVPKNTLGDLLGYCTFHQLKSTIPVTFYKCNLLLVRDFLGMLKS